MWSPKFSSRAVKNDNASARAFNFAARAAALRSYVTRAPGFRSMPAQVYLRPHGIARGRYLRPHGAEIAPETGEPLSECTQKVAERP